MTDEQISNDQTEAIFRELTSLGASSVEMNFWRKIFPALEISEKEELINNLKTQLRLLRK